jgi:hypothetical protein
MRNRLLAIGAILAGAAFVTVPVAAGLDPDSESTGATAAIKPVSLTEPGLAESAYWARVGRVTEAVQLNAFYEEIARQQAAAARRSRGGGSGNPGDCLGSIKDRESGGNYEAVSSSGTYRGAYQFDQRTWDSNAEASGRPELVGADPAAVDSASQDQVAADTYSRRGNQPWGGC